MKVDYYIDRNTTVDNINPNKMCYVRILQTQQKFYSTLTKLLPRNLSSGKRSLLNYSQGFTYGCNYDEWNWKPMHKLK